MSRLLLVRHAMPEVQQGVASSLWGLSDPAREDCVLMAHHLALAPGGTIHCSPERKASETADVLGLRIGRHVILDNDLREVDRPDAWSEDYRAQVAAYLGGELMPGWEPRERVLERFSAAVGRAVASSEERDSIVVSHGQAISLFVASKVELDVVAFWRSLSLPDAWLLDLSSDELSHLFEAGLPPPDA